MSQTTPTSTLAPCSACGRLVSDGWHTLDAGPMCPGSRVPTSKAPDPSDLEVATREARNLAVSLHRQHYSEVAQWKPMDDLRGVISQIDNMTAGLCRPSPQQIAQNANCSSTPDQAVIEKLREALTPFAAIGEWYERNGPSVPDSRRRDGLYGGGSPGILHEVTVGHYRSARKAIALLDTLSPKVSVEEECVHSWTTAAGFTGICRKCGADHMQIAVEGYLRNGE